MEHESVRRWECGYTDYVMVFRRLYGISGGHKLADLFEQSKVSFINKINM